MNNEEGENVVSSDNAYRGKPRTDGTASRGTFRGRGDGSFRGRGDGYRGRGGNRHWEEARQIQEVNSDQEVVELSEAQMNFIKETQAYVRTNIKVLSVSGDILLFLGRRRSAGLPGK